jgi:hypothetical protein
MTEQETESPRRAFLIRVASVAGAGSLAAAIITYLKSL